ncbi:MAG: rod shape-determining protein RodA [Candidatus Saganbacteria bacterium]|nr:rod shape-determining protein RodA [Candidatus Saganbacteria bacterium]
MINFRMLKYSDYMLWIALALSLFIGALLIYSSTASSQERIGTDTFFFLKKHLFSLIFAGIGLAIAMYFDYDHLKQIAIPLYIIILIFLAITLFSGTASGGAQRWISLGPLSFQPSEIAKLMMIVALAAFLEKRKDKLNDLLQLLPTFVLTAIPFAFIFKQPDLGTSLVLIAICFGMLAFAGGRPELLCFILSPILGIFFFQNIFLFIFYLIVIGIIMYALKLKILDNILILGANIGIGYIIPHIWATLREYQKMRLLTFLNPAMDPRGAGYHTLQAKIAVGGGGLFGKGLLHGTQTQLQFIPKQHTDFIFSVVGEELGFLGATLVLILFGIIIFRSIKIAMEARNPFGSLLAGGIAIMLTFHLMVNAGMTIGLLPVVGIPLPFFSFGGTSLLINLIAVGILQNIYMRRQKILF